MGQIGVHSVGDQPSDKLRRGIHRGQTVPCSKVNDQPLVRLSESVKPHDERIGTLPDCDLERRPEIISRSRVQKLGLDTKRSRRHLNLFPLNADFQYDVVSEPVARTLSRSKTRRSKA
jgi:hypothetical protein